MKKPIEYRIDGKEWKAFLIMGFGVYNFEHAIKLVRTNYPYLSDFKWGIELRQYDYNGSLTEWDNH